MLLTLDAWHHVEPVIQTASQGAQRRRLSERALGGMSPTAQENLNLREAVSHGEGRQWLVSTAGGTQPLRAPNGQGAEFRGARRLADGRACRRSRFLVEDGQPGEGRRGALLSGSRGGPGTDARCRLAGKRFLMVKPPAKLAAAPRSRRPELGRGIEGASRLSRR